ncbi:MAG: hypothetical protein QF794_01660 [Candidatus Marinimicrobia bacterium]|mgnify:CR=1 FL=1|jgi:hypothetical protein|nr:hypothetical protein [Candidatus Neomarinimicrobiota bacterium]|tara:strand:+ start:49 stop:252 length:204 start_codon:yes stop_codon:yes gene_type:complete
MGIDCSITGDCEKQKENEATIKNEKLTDFLHHHQKNYLLIEQFHFHNIVYVNHSIPQLYYIVVQRLS